MRSLSWMKGQFVRSAFCIALSLGLSAAITQSVSAQAPPSTPPGGTPGGGTPGTPVPPDQGGGNQGGGGNDKLKPTDFSVIPLWHFIDQDIEINQEQKPGAVPADFKVNAVWRIKASFVVEPNPKVQLAKNLMEQDYLVILDLFDGDNLPLKSLELSGKSDSFRFDTADDPAEDFELDIVGTPKFPVRLDITVKREPYSIKVKEYVIQDPKLFGGKGKPDSFHLFGLGRQKESSAVIGANVSLGKQDNKGTLEIWSLKYDRELDNEMLATDRLARIVSLPSDGEYVSGRVAVMKNSRELRKLLINGIDGVKIKERMNVPVRTSLVSNQVHVVEDSDNHIVSFNVD